jgi:pimeloyl-ACP methyl ester carboxylesterase
MLSHVFRPTSKLQFPTYNKTIGWRAESNNVKSGGSRIIKGVLVATVAVCLLSISAMASDTGLSEHTITVDDVKLHYVESGTGPTLVLIHGNPGYAGDFESGAIDALCGTHRVIAIDRPGHGDSDRAANADTVEEQAKLLHDEFTALELRKPVLVGHSWGGSLALAYALAYPDDVGGLVLVAPAAYADKGDPFFLTLAGKVPIIGELGALLGRSILSRGMVKKDLARAFYPQPVPDWYYKTVWRSWMGRKQLKAYFADEAQLNDSLSKMSDKYGDIQAPTVIITGDSDQIVDAKRNARQLHKVMKKSRIIEIANTGHEIPQTHPESIAEAISMLDRAS